MRKVEDGTGRDVNDGGKERSRLVIARNSYELYLYIYFTEKTLIYFTARWTIAHATEVYQF